MKGLVVRNPYAWCITQAWRDPAAKLIENRGYSTWYRGELAIVEGRRVDRSAMDRPAVAATIARYVGGRRLPSGVMGWEVGRGAVVCVADLRSICGASLPPAGLGLCDEAEGPWAAAGQYHWRLRNVRLLDVPVPVRGWQGLRDLPAEVEARVRAQLDCQAAAAGEDVP